MMKTMLTAIALTGLLCVTASAAEIDTKQAKCPVRNTAAVNAKQFVEYNGAKLFFCCGNCKAAFEKNPKKFATQANHQLVVTGQAEQKSCPITGANYDESKTLTVKNADVHFCCGNCLGKAEELETAEAVEAYFSPAKFKDIFKITKAE